MRIRTHELAHKTKESTKKRRQVLLKRHLKTLNKCTTQRVSGEYMENVVLRSSAGPATVERNSMEVRFSQHVGVRV